MFNNDLQKSVESAKSQIKYLESLSPEERRASVIDMRETQSQGTIFIIFISIILGLTGLIGSILVWLVEYKMNLMSSLGIIGGAILTAAVFHYIRSNRVKSVSKFQSDDFIDEDIIAYFREQEKDRQQSLDHWNKKGKYYFIAILGISILLFFLRSIWGFVFIFVGSGVSMLLIGYAIWLLIEEGKYRKKSKYE